MDILGIGNALVDLFCFSDDEIALPMGLHPNSAVHVSAQRMEELLLVLPEPIPVSGGGAANALKAAAVREASCAFIGCLGTDDRETDPWGEHFRRDLSRFGVETSLESRAAPTGRCLVIRMPGGMKSIACSPGAAPTLRPEQLDAALFAKARAVHLDGQSLRNGPVTERAVSLCSALGLPLSIDIASRDIAQSKAETVADALRRTRCTLFMNDEEAADFAKALDPRREADQVLAGLARERGDAVCLVRKMGSLGARAWCGDRVFEGPGAAAERIVDDTAAGDCFAGTFLAARLEGKTLGESLEEANRFAAGTLTVPGSDLEPPERP